MSEILRVLYADDNAADVDLTRAHLAGHAPDIALDVVDTGRGCLARLEESTYDLLLLDNHLPDMEGVDILRAVIEREVPLPVVMVTGVGDESLVVRVLRLGASDYVPKHGAYWETLPSVVRRAVAAHRRQQGYSHGTGARRRRILYVERHTADIDLTRAHFAEVAAHFSLEVAQDSEEALALLQKGGIDLVLADLRLPDMNALDLLRDARHIGLRVPFIIVTGKGDEHAALAALKLGASDYIVKRESYLTQLPHAIENAITRAQLAETNERLQVELRERERLARDNACLLEDARAAVRARDEFLAIAAHEIRGPLTAMRLAIQGLQSAKVPADAQPAVLDIIAREDRKLAQFVDELLDLARIRARTLQFTIDAVDLGDIVRQAVSGFGAELSQSGSSVALSTEGALVGHWDRSRLEQIVGNLLSNAIKFGLGRPINIGVRGDDASVSLRVTDHGTGIPKDLQAQIFEPFQREISVRNYGGLGLGLYIVRTIVDGLGGRLSFSSEPDAGSTFVVELPKAPHV
jgi:signal transduction histidine kinase